MWCALPPLTDTAIDAHGFKNLSATGRDCVFANAPAHPFNRYATVPAGHFDTSAAARDAVVGWLRDIAGR